MRFIPTSVHGAADYIVGLLLIAAPWLFGFSDNSAATWVPVVIGAGVILYSLFTRYELGAVKAISMPAHLTLDFIGGCVLVVSPWLFGFAEVVYWPHLIVGLFEIGAAVTTKTIPDRPVRQVARRA